MTFSFLKSEEWKQTILSCMQRIKTLWMWWVQIVVLNSSVLNNWFFLCLLIRKPSYGFRRRFSNEWLDRGKKHTFKLLHEYPTPINGSHDIYFTVYKYDDMIFYKNLHYLYICLTVECLRNSMVKFSYQNEFYIDMILLNVGEGNQPLCH